MLSTEGEAICWGTDEISESSPPEGVSFSAVSAGGWYTCALKMDGAIVCWGAEDAESDFGQISSPAESFTAISSGTFHTCAIPKGWERILLGSK